MKKYVRILLSFVIMLVLLPNMVHAATYEVSSTEEIKAAIENAADGDIIQIKGLKENKDFAGSVIAVSKSITISAEMEYEAYDSPYGQKFIQIREDSRLQNISFEIAQGATLTLTHVEITGADGRPTIFGGGNLLINDRTGIHAKAGQDAVNLPTGSVEVTGIEILKTDSDYSDLVNQVKAERGESFLRGISFPYPRPAVNSITGGNTSDMTGGQRDSL